MEDGQAASHADRSWLARVFARKRYVTRRDKLNHFIVGLGGFYAFNSFMACLSVVYTVFMSVGVEYGDPNLEWLAVVDRLLRAPAPESDLLTGLVGVVLVLAFFGPALITLLVNLVGLIYLGITRHWIAIGALVGLSSGFLCLVVVGGLMAAPQSPM